MVNLDEMVEVTLSNSEDFLKVRETLTRIGVASRRDKKLYQSCHILHKQKRYFIVHFKELFALDGKPTNFSAEDRSRRNTIANLLDQWSLVSLVDSDMVNLDLAPISHIKILSHKDKEDWTLEPKYNIGKKRE
jgi:hypothetical protein